jgi:TetR/AcrR family transcriptional regulator, regulator of cefoperazone and chloramphenicol sensitivity
VSERTATLAPRGEETRQRLLETAIRLFAADGFARVTVRDLCRAANTNLAAVNYHYGDKFGLYMAVARAAVDVMWSVTDLTMPPDSETPERKLRHYVQTYVSKLTDFKGAASWIHRLMQHEMAEPTPAAAWIVEHAIRPRLRYLSGVVGELLGAPPTDERVRWCVVMIQSQCLSFMPNAIRSLAMSDWPQPVPTDVDAIVDYIMTFSLAGIQAMSARR